MCKRHPDQCKRVRATGHLLEFVPCPWCGFPVATASPFNWCAECYVLYRIEGTYAHFSKTFEPSQAQALAMALAKSGGVSFGDLT